MTRLGNRSALRPTWLPPGHPRSRSSRFPRLPLRPPSPPLCSPLALPPDRSSPLHNPVRPRHPPAPPRDPTTSSLARLTTVDAPASPLVPDAASLLDLLGRATASPSLNAVATQIAGDAAAYPLTTEPATLRAVPDAPPSTPALLTVAEMALRKGRGELNGPAG